MNDKINILGVEINFIDAETAIKKTLHAINKGSKENYIVLTNVYCNVLSQKNERLKEIYNKTNRSIRN